MTTRYEIYTDTFEIFNEGASVTSKEIFDEYCTGLNLEQSVIARFDTEEEARAALEKLTPATKKMEGTRGAFLLAEIYAIQMVKYDDKGYPLDIDYIAYKTAAYDAE